MTVAVAINLDSSLCKVAGKKIIIIIIIGDKLSKMSCSVA